MKIIFLDIDGVLNSSQHFKKRGDRKSDIDYSKLPLLKQILDKTDAKIVLSSTWRYLRPKESDKLVKDKEQLDKVYNQFNSLVEALATINTKIYDYTPDIHGLGYWRGDEIQEWLRTKSRRQSY